jgi:hypothetical protein
MLFASRLPLGEEFLLPRRGGFALYRAAWALFSTTFGRAAFSVVVLLVLLASAASLAVALWRAGPRRLSALPGPLFALALSARLVSHELDLIQLVWFPYASMDAREPLAAFALAALAFVPAAAAARDWVAGRRRRATMIFLALVVLDVGGTLFAAAKGVGRALPPRPEGRTSYVVLTETEKGPDRDVYVLPPDVFAGRDARPELLELASGPRDARTLPALRALYEDETMRWDADGLRRALLLGVGRGDVLAVSVLLARSAAVPPSPEARAALGALADESRWRVGPVGAAELSRAYAHLGDAAAAASWAARAEGGIAPGLLASAPSGALKPGRISGTLRGPRPARVALYLKADPAAPYLLDAAGFIASAAPDAKGRFSFSGLAAGRYYLAVAFPAGDGPRGEISVSGSRGDLVLDARRPSLDLPPLTIKAASR